MRGADRVPLLLIGLAIGLALLAPAALAADTTTTVHVVKVASDGSTVLAERTVDYSWLKDNLPVMGDGSTHYYHQGPTNDPTDLWDPTESKSWQDDDMGALKGTAVKEICDNLVGGMSPGDTLQVKATDGMTKRFSYKTVYSPSARQGPMVLTWWRGEDGDVPAYRSGMRIVFFADTSTNSLGYHVFGVSDMRASMPESEWAYKYDNENKMLWPTTTALAIRYVTELRILSTTKPTTKTATPTPTPTRTATATSTATTGAPGVPTTTAPAVTTLGPANESGVETYTTVPSDANGSVVIPTEVPANGTAAVTTLDPAANLTGNVTPLENWTTVPTAPPNDTTYYYSATEPTTDIDEGSAVTFTPTPTVTANATGTNGTATVTPAAVSTALPPPRTLAPSLSPSPTARPGDGSLKRTYTFSFSFEVHESGGSAPAVNASAAVIPSTSPLGTLWALLKDLARMIDPFFT